MFYLTQNQLFLLNPRKSGFWHLFHPGVTGDCGSGSASGPQGGHRAFSAFADEELVSKFESRGFRMVSLVELSSDKV